MMQYSRRKRATKGVELEPCFWFSLPGITLISRTNSNSQLDVAIVAADFHMVVRMRALRNSTGNWSLEGFKPSSWPSVGSFGTPLCSTALAAVLFWPVTGFRHGSAESERRAPRVSPSPPSQTPVDQCLFLFFFQDDSLMLYSKTSSSYHHLVKLYKNSFLYTSFFFFHFFRFILFCLYFWPG